MSRDAILDLWAAGRTSPQIAAELGISRNVVIGQVKRARDAGDPRAVERDAPASFAAGAAARVARLRAAKQQSTPRERCSPIVTRARRAGAAADHPARRPVVVAGGGIGVAPPAAGTADPGRGCLFPLWGREDQPQRLFCGAPREPRADASYCAHHAGLCYLRVRPAQVQEIGGAR